MAFQFHELLWPKYRVFSDTNGERERVGERAKEEKSFLFYANEL